MQLTATLTSSVCYYTEFYINMDNNSGNAVNNASANFSSSPYTTSGSGNPLNVPQHITRYGNPAIKDTLNWIQIAGVYTATGGENYITIGNFKDNVTTTITVIPTGFPSIGYYYIDAVSVYSINPIGTLPWTYIDTAINSGDSVYIGNYLGGGFSSNWYLQGGGFIKNGSGIYVKPTVTSNYIVQFTICGVPHADTLKVTVNGVGVSELSMMSSDFVVSPNPNNGIIQVEILNKEFT